MLFRIAGSLALSVLSAGAADETGFVSLFNGQNLRGWVEAGRKGRGYVVEEGVLVCPADGGGNLFTAKEFADFILRFEFRLEPGGNNGVGIRAPLEGDAAYVGMEIQIIDDSSPKYAKLRPVQRHGSLYGVAPAKTGHLRPTGEWNEEEIHVEGRRVAVTLNGVRILDVDVDSVTDEALRRKHPGLDRTSGHIGFLGHGTRVEFRNIRVKPL